MAAETPDSIKQRLSENLLQVDLAAQGRLDLMQLVDLFWFCRLFGIQVKPVESAREQMIAALKEVDLVTAITQIRQLAAERNQAVSST